MDGLQEELRNKAPNLFRVFVVGEGIYFTGMFLMATGLGASLGPNPLLWGKKVKEMMSAATPTPSRGRLFWVGFLMNALGSLTFGSLGIYAAATLLPHGARTLIPAALADLAFSLVVRLGFYRKLSKAQK